MNYKRLISIISFSINFSEVHFVYYVSPYNENLFESFTLWEEDYIIKNSNIDTIIQYVSRSTFYYLSSQYDIYHKI